MALDPRMPTRWKQLIKEAGDCWEWEGLMRKDGYGKLSGRQAHRVVFEQLVGPIQDGMELDHTCRNKACVKPGHLEPVTRLENIRRRYALYTHCKSGHEFSSENTYVMPNGRRSCRTCRAAASFRYRRRLRGLA